MNGFACRAGWTSLQNTCQGASHCSGVGMHSASPPVEHSFIFFARTDRKVAECICKDCRCDLLSIESEDSERQCDLVCPAEPAQK